MLLFWNKIKKIYSPCLVSVVHLAYFTETRKGEYIFLILFQKSNILFHRMILSFVILNSIQCLVERSNSQQPNCVT